MSAIPTEIELNEGPRSSGGEHRLPPAALAFYMAVAAAAAGFSAPFLGRLSDQRHGWVTFVIVSVGAAIAQLFVVVTPRRGRSGTGTLSYHTTGVFLLPAALLLPPQLAALVAIVQHVPEWLKKRQPWYIGTFNIANYVVTILTTLAAYHLILGRNDLLANNNLRTAVAGIVSCVVFVAVNHFLLATMFRLARGNSYTESGLFSFESLSAELVLAALGVGAATFWHANPWLIPLALAPLVLIHRSLEVPALQMEARVDPKTGLFNARHFAAALADELARAPATLS